MNKTIEPLCEPGTDEFDFTGLTPGIFSDIEDTPEGFSVFFSMIAKGTDGEPLVLTKHGMEWVETQYDAYAHGKGTVIMAFRGASKSVVESVFAAFRIGKEPANTNMVVRATHGAAKDTGAIIADIIEINAAWLLFFPHVIPDIGGSWNQQSGYNVIDTRVPGGRWAQMMAGRGASKTLMVMPITSKSIRGRRVNGILLMDDLHQDDNSESPVELHKVLQYWNDALSPTRTGHCWTVLIGTPVASNDLLHTLMAMKDLFNSIVTPIRKSDGTPTWHEFFPEERIKLIEEGDITGGPGFAKEYMCDLSLMMSRVFDYMPYPAENISVRWKKRGGLDYASIEGATNLKNRSHAALAIIAFNPDTADWVVEDVIVKQARQSEIEGWIVDAQNQNPNFEYTNIEIDGKGAEFFAIAARNPGTRLKAEKTGGRNKLVRLERGLEPVLRTRRLKVSDGNTQGLNILRETLNNYPNIDKRGPGLDVLDAVYWAIYDDLMVPLNQQGRQTPKEKKPNPYFVLAQME